MRKGNAVKRDVLPDPIYNSKLVTRLINKLMLDGKKGTAQNILYSAFKKIEEKTGKPAMDVFATAINNIMPEVELKMRRVGGANFPVPTEVSPERKVTLGLRAANGTGASVKKREDTHKMAEANKAYSHYRW